MQDGGTFRGQIQVAASRAVFVLLALYCTVGAVNVVLDSARLLHNPWENTYFESPQTYAALYAAQTGKLYIPMSQPPYTPQPYAPLYYAANAYVAKAAGLDVDLFIFDSRLTTYIAYLLCGVMVFMICEAAAVPLAYAILAALMMLGHPDFLGANASPRPDMLYLLAMLMSLYCAVKWEDHVWRGYGLAGFFAGIAFLVKQPGLAVAMAIFMVLAVQKEFKKAAVLTVSTILPVAITFLVLYWRRDPFVQQMTFAGKSMWSFRDGANFVIDHLLVGAWIVPLGIGALGFGQAVNMGTKQKLIASFALVNWLVGFAGIGQIGGYLNYFLPGLTGCALLLPYAIELFRQHVRLTASLAIACAALLWATTSGYADEKGASRYFPAPTKDSLTWLRPYRVISDLTTMNMHGREPMLLDPFGAHVLELTGNWDGTPVLESLERGDYDLIILTRVSLDHLVPAFRGVSDFSPEQVRMMNEKYEILCSTDRSTVLMPRGREVAATPEMFARMFQEPCWTYLRPRPMDLKLEPGAR
jgi:hypothetical protein